MPGNVCRLAGTVSPNSRGAGAPAPWTRSHANQGVDLADYPNVKRWFDAINARPAVGRAVKVLADRRRPIQTDKEKEILFGATQYQRHTA